MELIQRGTEQVEQSGGEFQHGSIEVAGLDSQPLELSLPTGEISEEEFAERRRRLAE